LLNSVVLSDAAAHVTIRRTLKLTKANVLQLEQLNHGLNNDINDLQRSFTLRLEELCSLKELEAECERDQFKQTIHKLKDEKENWKKENENWKKELKQSAVLLEKLYANYKDENDQLNSELLASKLTCEELRKEILTNQQELSKIKVESDHYTLG